MTNLVNCRIMRHAHRVGVVTKRASEEEIAQEWPVARETTVLIYV